MIFEKKPLATKVYLRLRLSVSLWVVCDPILQLDEMKYKKVQINSIKMGLYQCQKWKKSSVALEVCPDYQAFFLTNSLSCDCRRLLRWFGCLRYKCVIDLIWSGEAKSLEMMRTNKMRAISNLSFYNSASFDELLNQKFLRNFLNSYAVCTL